ncbi:MAG: OmpH family outer membrane protein [Gammaproteobacteria bacterium]|nr:OmpH family outer membrane protein [Gammaproteobacteria bacterium]
MRLFAVLVSLAVMVAVAQPAAADLKIAYLDGQAVLNNSQAGKKEREKIEKFFKQKKTELEKTEKQLDAQRKQFDKDKLTMSKAQSDKWKQEFTAKVQAYQQETAKAQREVQDKEREFTRRAGMEIQKIVVALAAEKKISMVLEKSASGLLFAEDSMDITADVIKQFDAKFK